MKHKDELQISSVVKSNKFNPMSFIHRICQDLTILTRNIKPFEKDRSMIYTF